jgi:hypothetical protein
MKKRSIFLCIGILILCTNCGIRRDAMPSMGKLVRDDRFSELPVEERLRRKAVYWAIMRNNNAELKEVLDSGADPNECIGFGWVETNTLNVVMRNIYNVHLLQQSAVRKGLPENTYLSDPVSDVAVFQTLTERGADIHKEPYIWFRVTHWGNRWIEIINNKTRLIT